jgi:hypothetical protein
LRTIEAAVRRRARPPRANAGAASFVSADAILVALAAIGPRCAPESTRFPEDPQAARRLR